MLASAAVASGGIFTQTTDVSFSIAAGDRKSGKTNVPITLVFNTSTSLPTNGKITLNYPVGFFAATPNPADNAAGSTSVPTMTATSTINGSSIIITTAVVGIDAITTFNITLGGLTMGAATAGSATGITVQTDTDRLASVGAASGNIAFVGMTVQGQSSGSAHGVAWIFAVISALLAFLSP
jgi:hypothetical protein